MPNHTFLIVNGLQFSKSLAGKIVKVGQRPDFPDEVTIQRGEVLHRGLRPLGTGPGRCF
jgi:hypothetical protein